MSLWGGFDEPANVTDSGCEKRYEVDVNVSESGNSLLAIAKQQWQVLMNHLKEEICETKEFEALTWIRTPQCAIIVTKERVVVTSSAVTLLHLLVAPLTELCNTMGNVQWSSFMRKNIASPWEPDNEMNHVMASEYAELKQAFPQGKSFLIGPVDGDHYFYFVYDALNRKHRAVQENDAQVNLVMYNVAPEAHQGESSNGKVVQCCTPLDNKADEYEALRHFYACGQRCVTFETNATTEAHADRIVELLEEFQPDRFTLITLFDLATVVAQRYAKGDRCGLDKFAKYKTENCFTNEFAHGYTVRKTVFVRAAI
jgi:S-adenosylmethionine decarboxylase